MIRHLPKAGCLVLLAVFAGIGYLLVATDLGRTLTGLVVVYGGAMVSGAVSHETVPGVVTEIKRLDPPAVYSAGSLTFRYGDDEGKQRTASRRVVYSTPNFRNLNVGDEISVWVCRENPAIVRLVGYGTYEPETCGSEPEPR